ncbi:hypothetical protein RRG08_060339 [Elysia crispata]|uniref:Uncharacterized protein n=1 Tax=Elysia crispata TaxID=231223 RepID=A0AAE1DFR1_9GAST|nr:hypothetical protein RRG08_060339 [Elysia crispata]
MAATDAVKWKITIEDQAEASYSSMDVPVDIWADALNPKPLGALFPEEKKITIILVSEPQGEALILDIRRYVNQPHSRPGLRLQAEARHRTTSAGTSATDQSQIKSTWDDRYVVSCRALKTRIGNTSGG